jgi:hypothetical protein
VKSVVASFAILFVAACSSSNNTSTSGTTTAAALTNGSTGGGASTGGSGNSGTGSSSGGATSSSGGTTGSVLGAPCTVDPSTGADSCVPGGYVCTAEDIAGGGSGTCILPQQSIECLPSVGCQDGGNPELTCTTYPTGTPTPDHDYCFYPCAQTTDCLSIEESCQANANGTFCFQNFCNVVDPTVLGTCPVLDAGDGQCLSFSDDQYALCLQNGSTDTGGPCNPFSRNEIDSACRFDDLCVPNSATGADGGLCYPLILSGACPDGEVAVRTLADADFVICAPDCTDTNSCVFDGGIDAGGYEIGTCHTLTGVSYLACLP